MRSLGPPGISTSLYKERPFPPFPHKAIESDRVCTHETPFCLKLTQYFKVRRPALNKARIECWIVCCNHGAGVGVQGTSHSRVSIVFSSLSLHRAGVSHPANVYTTH